MRHPTPCIALLTLLALSLGCSEFVVIGIEPEIAAAYGVSLSQAGELISAFAITYAVCTPLLAIVTGKFKRFHLLVAFSILFCLGNVAAVAAPTFELLLCSRVLLGAVSGPLLAVGITYIPELVGVKRASMAISVVYAAFSIAMVLATSIGKLVSHALDWHAALIGTLALALVVCAALVAVLPRTGEQDEPATMREQAVLLTEPSILTGAAVFVFGVGSVYVFYGYVSPYLETVLGLDAVAASTVLMAYGVATFFSNLASGWLDARFGLRALLVSFPVQALLLCGLWLAGGNAPVALALIVCIGLSMYLLSVPSVSLFMRVARQNHPKALTLASSLEPMEFNTGISFGTAMGGAVVAGAGIGWAGLVGALCSIVACVLVAVTIRLDGKRQRPRP